MDPLTPLDTLCRIILRAKEYEAQVPSNFDDDEDEDADSVNGTDGEVLSALEDGINTSVEDELRSALDDLGEDQLAEVFAFALVGQGSYDASEWDEAIEAAGEENDLSGEIMQMPMFASVLENGMAAFGLNCDGIGEVS